MAMDNYFEFFTGFRGFHVYSNSVNWKLYKGQKVTFKREHKNPYGKFAVAEKTLLKGCMGSIILDIFQGSYFAIFGMPFKGEWNFDFSW